MLPFFVCFRLAPQFRNTEEYYKPKASLCELPSCPPEERTGVEGRSGSALQLRKAIALVAWQWKYADRSDEIKCKSSTCESLAGGINVPDIIMVGAQCCSVPTSALTPAGVCPSKLGPLPNCNHVLHRPCKPWARKFWAQSYASSWGSWGSGSLDRSPCWPSIWRSEQPPGL